MYSTQMNQAGGGGKGDAEYLARREVAAGFPTAKTALLVIDPVNDFLSEGGAAWDMTKETVKLHNVVENLQRAIAGARAHGVPVLFGPMAYTEEDYADMALHRRSGINRIMFERKMFLAGSWGADFHPDLRPEGTDIVLLPHKGTDVFQTDLPDHLRSMGITHLVIVGMAANLCCESTGRHATEAGYDVTFLSDAIGSESIPSYEAAVNLNFPLIANGVMKVEEFLAALGEQGQGVPSAQAGDVVRGSDHLEVGKVKDVVPATDMLGAHIVIPGGLIFGSATYIPLDAVVKRVGGEIFINVPKLVVGMMPWGDPPTLEEQRLKMGPRAVDVAKLYGSRSPSVQEGPARGA